MINMQSISNFFKAYKETPSFIKNRWQWARRQAALPQRKIDCVIEIKDGARFHLADDPIDDKILFSTYQRFIPLYFPDILTNLGPDSLIVDIGAHHGFFAVGILAKHPKAKLIAIEPDPYAIPYIKRNLEINNLSEQVDIIQAAVGMEGEEINLVHYPNSSWSNHCYPEHEEAPGGEIIKVPNRSIVKLLNGRTPDFIKCNAEGAEYIVFPSLFEANIFPRCIALFGHPEFGDLAQLHREFEHHGYDVIPTCSTAKRSRHLCILRT